MADQVSAQTVSLPENLQKALPGKGFFCVMRVFTTSIRREICT